ncbi:hypothetical protein chiPu_0030683 [Chiloscyllium punctatum]|uniref:Uncharacterized protein n=1 Tax=Chiloscyllium punctatum TaxID=137246 RepID=A0A401TVH2_CHIPU|nr:hypothetical protein [Chiloscyllium punctatum]
MELSTRERERDRPWNVRPIPGIVPLFPPGPTRDSRPRLSGVPLREREGDPSTCILLGDFSLFLAPTPRVFPNPPPPRCLGLPRIHPLTPAPVLRLVTHSDCQE